MREALVRKLEGTLDQNLMQQLKVEEVSKIESDWDSEMENLSGVNTVKREEISED